MDILEKSQPNALPLLVSAKEICGAANFSRAHLYDLVSEGYFPSPAVRIGSRFTRWSGSAVQQWLDNPQAWIDTHRAVAA